MAEGFEEYLFTPECFLNDLKKIFKYINNENKQKILIKGDNNNRIFQITNKNSIVYITNVYSDLSPSLLLDKLKEYNHMKHWFPYVTEVDSMLRITQYSDILDIKFSIPLLKFFKINTDIQIIRYWSYSSEEHSYFLLFKTFNDKNILNRLKHIKYAGFVIKMKQDINDSGCILYFMIKFKKSFKMIDNVFRHLNLKFCSSLPTFLASIKMYKYNIGINPNQKYEAENVTDDKDIVSSNYLIHYLTTFDFNNSEKINNQGKAIMNVNVYTKLEDNLTNPQNVILMKALYELKGELGDDYLNSFPENELVRYIVGFKANVEKAKNALLELDYWRNSNNQKNLNIYNEIIDDTAKNIISILGQDKYLRPILVLKMPHNGYIGLEVNKFIRYFNYMLNKAIEMMPANVDKLMIIVNIKNFNLSNNYLEIFKKINEILNVNINY